MNLQNQSWNSRKSGFARKVPTRTGSDEPQTYFFPPDTLNWLVHLFEGSWSLDGIPSSWTYIPYRKAGGLGTGTPGSSVLMILAVGQNSQQRGSRVLLILTSQRSPFNTSNTEIVAHMATSRWVFLCCPSVWNGWAESTWSLPFGVSFSTYAEFQDPVMNIYRQEKEKTTRLMTLQYSFRQGTPWYHILPWHQVFKHIIFSMQGITQKRCLWQTRASTNSHWERRETCKSCWFMSP